MKKLVIYIHGKGGKADDAERYRRTFLDSEVIGFDYKAQTPWAAKEEFRAFLDSYSDKYGSIVICADSIGAYFSMVSLFDKPIERAYFISPIVDMEKLIYNMMKSAGVTEEELKERGVIGTEFGEDLSWKYLSYVKEHKIKWDIPTKILYGENDVLTDFETVRGFAETHNATLTVMPGGEHWFHTEEQMRFLDSWLLKSIRNYGEQGFNI
ncbi:MAG: alpha/beta hydrolase [Oscillospiraceae bacterium]|nr:alpha/beta hydrolase [Oscillospiraceae bacterium]